jgi:hypothetical protein
MHRQQRGIALARLQGRACAVRRTISSTRLTLPSILGGAREFSRASCDQSFADNRFQSRQDWEKDMRAFLLIASALLAFAATMAFEPSDANAVVCARGVYRAGCAGPNGAVVVREPVPVVRCTRVLVDGVYVKRCV